MSEETGLIRDSRVTTSPTLRELAATLFRQSRLVAACFFSAFVAVLLYAWLSPRYEAHLNVLLRRGRSDPIVSSEPPSPLDFIRPEISEEELNSEVELLHDESLLKKVAETTGLVPAKVSDPNWISEVQRAARNLARDLKVEPVRKSNLIQISYRSTDPEEAAHVLSALSDAYVQMHMALRRPSGELGFFQQQTEDYAKKLHQSEAQLVNFTIVRGVSSAALERDITVQKLGEAEAGYRQICQDRAEADRRIVALREQLASFPSRSVTQKHWADNPMLLEKLKNQLLELQLKRTELLTRFEPSYRLVQEVDRQIEETRQSIAAEALTPVRDETTDKDPNYEWARMELEKSQVQSESLRAREAAAYTQTAALRTLAQQRQSDSVAQQDLIRTAKAEEDRYLLYLRKREEARIGDALDERRILNVAVVEAPVVPALPVHPPLLYFLLAFGVALAFSIGVAFTAEYFDPTIRTPAEAKDLLEAPVLAWLPPVKNQARAYAQASHLRDSRLAMSSLVEPISDGLAAAEQPRLALANEQALSEDAVWETAVQHEQVRALVQQLFFPRGSPPPRRIGFTAAEPQTDTAHLCFDMASVLAETGTCDVGLIDAHPGAPPLHLVLGLPSGGDLNTAWQISPRLWLLPRVAWLPENEEQLVSDQCLARLGDRSAQFDFSILCGAPVSWPTIKIAQACDGLVLVLAANRTRRMVALQKRDQLRSARIPLLGTVLAERRFPIPQGLYRNL